MVTFPFLSFLKLHFQEVPVHITCLTSFFFFLKWIILNQFFIYIYVENLVVVVLLFKLHT